MKQIDTHTYEVSPGEEVIVVLVAHKVIDSAGTFSVSGRVPTQPVPGKYPWRVTRSAGQIHGGVVDCKFPAGSPPDAMFVVSVGAFDGPTIRQSLPPHEEFIEFRVK